MTLHSQSLNNSPAIILVRPQLGENIGAAARAMKNFSLEELRIVAPRDGWPNIKASTAAVGAVNIVEQAKIYSNLLDAVADLEFLYATTGQKRTMNKEYISTIEIQEEFESKNKIGILFGCESSGLTNEEISLANKMITVNTDPEFTSLNIAQAVLLVCYEAFCTNQYLPLSNNQELATKEELQYFYTDLFGKLEQKNFFKVPEKTKQMQLNIINIFSRIDNLSKSEIQTLRGIINCLNSK